MKVSPREVYDLSKEGLPASEIAQRLKISRALVNLKLIEYELDKREYELDNRKREVDMEEADLEARKSEIDKIPELEEKTRSLKSMVDSFMKERNELEGEIKSNREVLDEIKDFEKRREEVTKQLSELSNSVDLQRRSAKKLYETEKQIEMENLSLFCIRDELDKNREINMKLVDENYHLKEENRVKKEAIKEIEGSFYGFIELTKQIALYMQGGLERKTKAHEEMRSKAQIMMMSRNEERKGAFEQSDQQQTWRRNSEIR